MTKRTRTIPVRATTIFFPIEEKSHVIKELAIPGEEEVEAEEADMFY
jgi:hypothetical protein